MSLGDKLFTWLDCRGWWCCCRWVTIEFIEGAEPAPGIVKRPSKADMSTLGLCWGGWRGVAEAKLPQFVELFEPICDKFLSMRLWVRSRGCWGLCADCAIVGGLCADCAIVGVIITFACWLSRCIVSPCCAKRRFSSKERGVAMGVTVGVSFFSKPSPVNTESNSGLATCKADFCSFWIALSCSNFVLCSCSTLSTILRISAMMTPNCAGVNPFSMLKGNRNGSALVAIDSLERPSLSLSRLNL